MTRPRYYIAHLFWFTALFLSVFSGAAAASQTTGGQSKIDHFGSRLWDIPERDRSAFSKLRPLRDPKTRLRTRHRRKGGYRSDTFADGKAPRREED